jgi:type II secretory pathway pseudopilin PulG
VTLIDVMVGLTILAFVTAALLSIFISAIAQARTSGVRGEAAAWAQSELDYLRYVGYTNSCLSAGTRTITPTSVPCTSVEPPLPPDLAQATVQVENNIGQTGLKRITIQISRESGIVLYTVVTYETQFL